MSETRELTFGEKAVGLTFNHGNNPDVEKIKRFYANVLDLIDTAIKQTSDPEVIRMFKIAITETQTAQMWAVKAITWK